MEGQDHGVPSLFVITLIQFFVGVLLFIALLYGHRELTVLTLLVLGVTSGTRLWARMSLSSVRYDLRVDRQKVFPGETLTIKLRAENAKLLPIWLEMNVYIGTLLQGTSGERVLRKESGLLWYQRTGFQWELTAERRGVYQIGPLYILAGDLFSFFSRHKRAEKSYPIIVYPRLISLKSVSLPRRDFFGVPRAKSPVQDPIYILGTRDYQNGQPSKYIHWKASARQHRLQEKVFESTQQEKVLFVVNVEPFERRRAEEDFERTLEVVASLAVRLDQQGHSIGLIANGIIKGGGSPIVAVARNDQQLPAILELLARLQMKSDRDLKELLRHKLTLTWGISCVYFSHQEDETVSTAEQYFTQRRTPVVFFVCRPRLPSGKETPGGQPKAYRLEDICTR
ncbi:MAG: DUF58 domain-containing protein [Thermodesulfobacteriota bacterium]